MFNFPNTPSLGDIYQPVGGPSYQWDGQKWMMTGSAIISTPAYDQRNRVVNPAMQISQENGSTAGTTTNYYPADQWVITNTTDAAFSSARTIGPLRKIINIGVTTADASITGSQSLRFEQKIEGTRIHDFLYGTSSARQSILHFNFSGPAGTYSIALRNTVSTPDRSYVDTFTISAAQAGANTTQTFIIPGDTTGTWTADNTAGLWLTINVAAGPTLQAPSLKTWLAGNYLGHSTCSNGASSNSNVFYLWDVGLYLDATGSGLAPAWEMPDEASELIACQRYWQKAFAAWYGNTTSASVYYANTTLPVSTRINPTLTSVTSSQSGFPTTDTLTVVGYSVVQASRTANATVSGGYFQTVITANARM